MNSDTRVRGRHRRAEIPAAPKPASRLTERWRRFIKFGSIGAFVFVAGTGLQWGLVKPIGPVWSFLAQTLFSVDLSLILNWWLTWPDRDLPFWRTIGRWHVQKILSVALNTAAYLALLKLGTGWLVANLATTAVFTVLNFFMADRWSFAAGNTAMLRWIGAAARIPLIPFYAFYAFTSGIVTTVRSPARRDHEPQADALDLSVWRPGVSIVVPCKSSERTVLATVEALLNQDYPQLREVITVGDIDDSTWTALAGISDPRLIIVECAPQPGKRDSNIKRDAGIARATGDLVALTDSDIIMDSGWLTRAVALLQTQGGEGLVAGGMHSAHDSFWGRFVDSNILAAKTARLQTSYTVEAHRFGRRRHKPPLTANCLFTRKLYEAAALDVAWLHGYEDYDWFWRMVRDGHQVTFSRDLSGAHHHRRSFRALSWEYRRSGIGAAHFAKTHRDCPLARKRMAQAVGLPLAGIAVLGALAVATCNGYALQGAAVITAVLGFLGIRETVHARRLEALAYPFAALPLGMIFTYSLARTMITPPRNFDETGLAVEHADFWAAMQPERNSWYRRAARRVRWPLVAILAVQAGLSLSLVWSNTAFTDEAEYLWGGRLELLHLLHGTPVPSTFTSVFSGDPLFYPPIGALASSVGGLAAARLLSLIFMLVATSCLYGTTRSLYGERAALIAAVLWVISEPVMRLGAYATYDAMSDMLLAAGLYVAVRSIAARRTGEWIALGSLLLALSSVAAYSAIGMVPLVILLSFTAAAPSLGWKKALAHTAWLAAGTLLVFAVALTFSKSWQGLLFTVILRNSGTGFQHGGYGVQSYWFIIKNVWSYSFLYIALGGWAGGYGLLRLTGFRRITVAISGLAVFLVPLEQLHEHTETSLDKHLAYGILIGCMAIGYLLSQMPMPRISVGTAVVSCALLLAYPATNAWQAAWYKQTSWGNSTSLIDALRSVMRSDPATLLVSNGTGGYVGEYYLPSSDGRLGTLSLEPSGAPSGWTAYYSQLLSRPSTGAVAVVYTTSAPAGNGALPSDLILHPTGKLSARLLRVVAYNTNQAAGSGLPDLTEALESDRNYRLIAVGPLDGSTISQVYAIWEHVH
jgi:GT2 family glycosyltransferase